MKLRPDSPSARDAYAKRIRDKEARRVRARRQRANSTWAGIGTFGMVGWSVAIPTLIGIALGLWLDAQAPQRFSWTLTLMVGGVLLGCVNAWYWVSREQRLILHEMTDEELEEMTDDDV